MPGYQVLTTVYNTPNNTYTGRMSKVFFSTTGRVQPPCNRRAMHLWKYRGNISTRIFKATFFVEYECTSTYICLWMYEYVHMSPLFRKNLSRNSLEGVCYISYWVLEGILTININHNTAAVTHVERPKRTTAFLSSDSEGRGTVQL